MAKAVRFHETGGPEVLRYEDVEVGDPGPGQVRLRHEAVGLNFADIYFRSGLYPVPLPAGMGVEAAGVVEAVGEGVTNVAVGDRVTYTGFINTLGAYSTERLCPAAPLIKAGTVRALGVSSTTRVAILPDVPPISENGVPGFDAVAWLMLVAPAAVPSAVVEKLHGDLKAVVAMPETQQKFAELGVIPIDTLSVTALQAFVKAEIRRWGQVVEHAGLAGSE